MKMVSVRACIWRWALGTVLAALGPVASAQDAPAAPLPLIPAEKHPWARYPVGSWSLVRITSENFDQRGVATVSVEELKKTLQTVDARHFTLRVERTVEIGGRKFAAQTWETMLDYSGEPGEQKIDVKKLGDAEMVINGRKIPCEVRQAVVNDGEGLTTVKVYFSPDVTPYALRREWIKAQSPQAAPVTTVEEVVALGMPFTVLGERRTAAFIHTHQKLPTQTKETMEVVCDEVPGGIVSQWSKELDADGKLIGRTTLELTGYQVEPPRTSVPSGRGRLLDRKRQRRADEKMGSPRRNP